MIESKNCLSEYDYVSEDVRFVSNSLIRLKVLKTLYEKPQNMKELTDSTKLSYSSVSGILHSLELKDMVYRKSNKYFLVNSLGMQMKNILELTEIVNVLDEVFNIVFDHIVDNLPERSIDELYMLDGARLLESDGVNADKIYNILEDILRDAESARCILPIYYDKFNHRLNELANEDKFVEIMVAENIFDVYEEKSEVKYVSSFDRSKNFLLILTDRIMVLGFFKADGIFDQNRLLVSTSNDSLKWADNLYRYFKKENK